MYTEIVFLVVYTKKASRKCINIPNADYMTDFQELKLIHNFKINFAKINSKQFSKTEQNKVYGRHRPITNMIA